MSALRVFVSYRHDDDAHMRRVRGIADSLCSAGIDCTLDQALAPSGPSDGWPLWVQREIESADAVLVICTPGYVAALRNDTREGLGAAYEFRLIAQLVYESRLKPRRIVPVVFSSSNLDTIPMALRGLEHVVLEQEQDNAKLLRILLAGAPAAASADAPNAEQRFRGTVETSLTRWRLFDLQRDIVLDTVYVQEKLADAVAASPLMPIYARSPAPRWREEQVFDDVATARSPLVIIEGRAGAGKTTMTRNWTVRFARTHDALPVYFALRYLAPARGITTETLAEAVRRSIPELQDSDMPLLREAFDSSEKRRTSFICDGLDELAPALHEPFLEWVRRRTSGQTIVITSRPGILPVRGYPPRAKAYELCDFDRAQIDQFVSQWFTSMPALGASLIQAIVDRRQLARLARIPLLLACLCMHVEIQQDCDFPPNILESDLLHSVVTIMLDRWDAAKEHREYDSRTVSFGVDLLTSLIATDRGYAARFTRDEMMAQARRLAPLHGLGASNAEAIVQRIVRSGRMIEGRPAFGYAFSHKLFFDYFFARRVHAARGTS